MMGFFTSGLFWFLEGICFCLMAVAVKYYIEDMGARMSWWKWILFAGWVLLFGFTNAFIGTSIGENEITAATIGGLMFGLATLISGVGIWRLLKVGKKKPVNL